MHDIGLRYGARVVNLSGGVLLIEQTHFSAAQGRYVIDHRLDGTKVEKHVRADDDNALGLAIRAAVAGEL